MSRRWIVAAALVACSSKREPAPAQNAPPPPAPARPAQVAPASLPPGEHLGFIPDTVAVRVGHSKVLAAVDLRAFKDKAFLALIPQHFACTRDLVEYAGVVVLAADTQPTLYATQLSEANTKQCLTSVASGHTRTAVDGSFEVGDTDGGVSLRWDGGVLTVHALGSPADPAAIPDATLFELMQLVPPQAPAFLISHDRFDLKTLVAWAQTDKQALSFTVRGEGSSAEAARSALQKVLDGAKAGAREQHYAVDPSWFKESVTGNTATVEGRIPLSALRR